MSIPDGINQMNRAHPYFILLRRHSDEQKELAEQMTKMFVRCTIYMALFCLIPLLAFISLIHNYYHVNLLWLAPVPAILALAFTLAFITRGRFRHMKDLIRRTIYTDVEHMIFSNDYQQSLLNYEQVIDKVLDTVEVTGEMREFHRDTQFILATFGIVAALTGIGLVLI